MLADRFRARCVRLRRVQTDLAARIWNEFGHDDVMLDISQFDGKEIEVRDLPASQIKYNPERHVVVRASWLESIEWDDVVSDSSIESEPVGFWRMLARRAAATKFAALVTTIPTGMKPYEELARRQLSQLLKNGDGDQQPGAGTGAGA